MIYQKRKNGSEEKEYSMRGIIEVSIQKFRYLLKNKYVLI